MLKTLLECLASDDKEVEIQVLLTLIEMLKCPDLVESFSKYAELLVLKVLHCHKAEDPSKPMNTTDTSSSPTSVGMRCAYQAQGLKTAEKCAAMIATVLPASQIIPLASTTITTEPYPRNIGAIKMLQEAAEHWGREAVEPHLAQIMPELIRVRIRSTAMYLSASAVFLN